MITQEKLEAQAALHNVWWQHTEMQNRDFQPRETMRQLERDYDEMWQDFMDTWGHAPLTETNEFGHVDVPLYPYISAADLVAKENEAARVSV